MAYPKVSHLFDTTPDGAGQVVPSSPRFPAVEEAVLTYWEQDGTFVASVENREAGENGANEFVFYDGPPFANGLPHYGHLLTGYVKDVVPRYFTMRGRRVERRFGWDTHGLPAELEAMSQLGIKTTDEIREMGIAAFNDKCRESVFQYTSDWQDYVTRQARWVDFDNDYKTLDLDYMESVIWAFKQLHDKGLAYEGFRVLPYCWNDQTPLSNHELRMDEDVYQLRQDPAVTVGCRLESGELALIWTTTPWTLTCNLAIMVGEDIEYAVVESSVPTGNPERYIIASERMQSYAREFTGDAKGDVSALVVERLQGSDLVGRHYTPPMDYYLGHEKAFRIVPAEFVTTTDGTGLVHTAGAFGEEDKQITDREGIEVVVPVGIDGCFTYPVTDYEGQLVLDANLPIIDHLKARTRHDADGAPGETGAITPGTVLLRRETYDHSYPHCWRCREPLIYMAVSSWFVSTTKIRDEMLALNQEITWVPGHVKDGQFGKWLENTRDWSISRNRFWGSPIPVWKSDDPTYPRMDVYGSLDEIERDFGVRPTDLHRPFIDDLTRPNPDDPTGKSTMRRGIVLGNDGLKMSKSLKNYPDVREVFDRDGADAMRWFLMSSPILRGGNLIVTEEHIRGGVRQALIPLWNSWYFFTLYANAADYEARWSTDSTDDLDRYILAKLGDYVRGSQEAHDAYDIAKACDLTREFVELLTNWYIRRNRDRFWAADGELGESSRQAFDTLYTVLETVSRVAAPLLPLVTEEIWRGLTGERSVHLTDWPEADLFPSDPKLVEAMDRVQTVCSTVSSLRKAQNLRVRQPLGSLTVVTPAASTFEMLRGIVAEEVNVKEIAVVDVDNAHSMDFGIVQRLNVNARAAGEAVLDATIVHRDLIVAETLATQFGASGSLDDLPASDGVAGNGVTETTVGADETVRIRLTKV
ncbi:MAG: isoleucine--tRNA ligase [Intrasporangiaceae bacterium]|nr:isoleucine--tRNA ligase [Intrasporangiaceae bacterium]